MRARSLLVVSVAFVAFVLLGCAACQPGDGEPGPLEPLCADGNVVDSYVDVTSVRKLETLRGCVRVHALNIETDDDDAWDLSPLATLESVETWFQILDDHASALASLEGLEALTHVGELRIEAPRVESLAPLRSLTNLYATSDDVESPGTLWIQQTAIRSLDGLENATGGLRALILSRNADLETLDGIPPVTELDRLEVSDSPALSAIAPLASIARIDEVVLDETAVSDLEPLPLDVGVLELHGTPLVDLSSLAGRTTLPALHISDAAGLTSLSSSDATSVPAVRVGSAPLLTTIRFPSATVGALSAGGPSLSEVSALSWEGAEIALGDCDVLGSLAFLAGTTTLASLVIEENAGLEALALDALVDVTDDVRILRNPALSQADAEARFAGVSVGGARKIAGNAGDTPRVGVCPWEDDGWCDAPDLCVTDTNDCEPGGD